MSGESCSRAVGPSLEGRWAQAVERHLASTHTALVGLAGAPAFAEPVWAAVGAADAAADGLRGWPAMPGPGEAARAVALYEAQVERLAAWASLASVLGDPTLWRGLQRARERVARRGWGSCRAVEVERGVRRALEARASGDLPELVRGLVAVTARIDEPELSRSLGRLQRGLAVLGLGWGVDQAWPWALAPNPALPA